MMTMALFSSLAFIKGHEGRTTKKRCQYDKVCKALRCGRRYMWAADAKVFVNIKLTYIENCHKKYISVSILDNGLSIKDTFVALTC